MKQRVVFEFGLMIAVGLALVVGPAMAISEENRDETPISLDEKQSELVIRASKIEQLNETYGRYKWIRETLFGGEHGLQKEASDLVATKLQWISHWYQLTADS